MTVTEQGSLSAAIVMIGSILRLEVESKALNQAHSRLNRLCLACRFSYLDGPIRISSFSFSATEAEASEGYSLRRRTFSKFFHFRTQPLKLLAAYRAVKPTDVNMPTASC